MARVDPPTGCCYTCRVFHGKDSPSEVWYDKVQHWVCLECHLTEKTLQKVKGKGTVSNIAHKCSGCDRGPPEEPESAPCCFCFDCSQFLCQECLRTEHMDIATCQHRNRALFQGKAQPGSKRRAAETAEVDAEKKRKTMDVPTPELGFAEYIFKTEICIDKPPTDNTIKTIAQQVTALMNTSGGLILLYSNTPDSERKRDRWIMGFGSHLANNWIPESLLQELLGYRSRETEGQVQIYIFVAKSPHLVTFDFHAFGRLTTGVRPIKELDRVRKMLNEPQSSPGRNGCGSEMKQILRSVHQFQIDDPIPVTYRESDTMEFKHCYDGPSKTTELPLFTTDILKKRLGENMKYLCAFANTQGGSLVLGVEEDGNCPVVRGFPVTVNQEAAERELTEYLGWRLGQCIWHGDPQHKPVMGQDWNVFYHKVIGKAGRERKMIEVRINKHSGGMFLQSPVYYVVDRNGQMEEKRDFKDWKVRFHATTAIPHTEKTNAQSDLQKHMVDTGIHEKRQEVQNNRLPEDQPQPAAGAAAQAAAEIKIPKSFKESRSEHKADIFVQSLSLHDCCTNRMAQYIKSLQAESEKTWYPFVEEIRKRLPDDACSDKLMIFLQGQEWKGLTSIVEIENESDRARKSNDPGLICHMLRLGECEPPLLISCFGTNYQCEIAKQNLESLVGLALDSGRELKRQLLENTANLLYCSCLFHFDMEVLLVPTEGPVETVWESKNVQPVEYPNTNQEQQYAIACNGLSVELLRTRASVKDRYGQILVEHLTEAQAKVLHAERKRVLIVSGKSGTGKTVIALHLAKEAKEVRKEEGVDAGVVYICSNEGLKSFVSSQVSCPVIVIKSTNSLSPTQKILLEKVSLIIVDEVHAIELDKRCKYWESTRSDSGGDDVNSMEIDEHGETYPSDLYMMLFKHAAQTNTRVAVFFDPEQDYKGNLPADFDVKLRHLAETHCGVLPQDIMIMALRERVRNSQEINRFMQANQNQANITGTIECLNQRPGDDVIYEYIGSSVEESAKMLNAKLSALEEKYGSRSVAILHDDHAQMNHMRTLLIDQYNKTFQDENEYPIHHTVISSLENFAGLEAEVILFLLPWNFRTENVNVNWKYVNVISSRARERVEFLLPWNPANAEEQQEQDRLFNLVELFKIPAVDYGRLAVTRRDRIQGNMLIGLTYSNGHLFTIEQLTLESDRYSYSLCVYWVQHGSGNLQLLDSLELGVVSDPSCSSPHIERYTQSVFVAFGINGVVLCRLEGDRLVRERTLTCVRNSDNLDVKSPDTLYVSDCDSYNVHSVDIRNDSKTSTLEKPDTVRGKEPCSVAVLGDSVMVDYPDASTLLLYRHGSPNVIRVIPHPKQAKYTSGINTDCQGHFLLTDRYNKLVFVMDVNGNLRYTVKVDADNYTKDCVVVNRQLWVACLRGKIIIMSSQ